MSTHPLSRQGISQIQPLLQTPPDKLSACRPAGVCRLVAISRVSNQRLWETDLNACSSPSKTGSACLCNVPSPACTPMTNLYVHAAACMSFRSHLTNGLGHWTAKQMILAGPCSIQDGSCCLLAWMQVLLPSVDEQAARPPEPPQQQQPASSGGIGSWLWGTMAGTAPPAPTPQPAPTHQPTPHVQPTPVAQPTSPHQPRSPQRQSTQVAHPIQSHSPTPLNEMQAPLQPYQPTDQEQQEREVSLRDQYEAGPSSHAPHQDRPNAGVQESAAYHGSVDTDAAARHEVLQQAFASHQTQVRAVSLCQLLECAIPEGDAPHTAMW